MEKAAQFPHLHWALCHWTTLSVPPTMDFQCHPLLWSLWSSARALRAVLDITGLSHMLHTRTSLHSDSEASLWRSHTRSSWFGGKYLGLGYSRQTQVDLPVLMFSIWIVAVQLLSHVWLFATPWTEGFPVHHQLLLKVTSIESVMPPNHLGLCRPLLLPSLFPSIGVFSNESTSLFG